MSKERVLRAAVALADQGGIEALSMRKLGRELGVEAMSLYNHVADKEAILDGIVDLVVGEIDLPAGGSDWKCAMRRSAISAHEVLSRHPWAGDLWWHHGGGPARLRWGNSVLGCLREAGFSSDLTYHAFHILEGHIVGFTLQQLNFPLDADQLPQAAADFLRRLSTDRYPHLAEHVRQHLEPGHDEGGAFAFGLDLILDGLERLSRCDVS